MSSSKTLVRAVLYKNSTPITNEIYPGSAETAFVILRLLQPEHEFAIKTVNIPNPNYKEKIKPTKQERMAKLKLEIEALERVI